MDVENSTIHHSNDFFKGHRDWDAIQAFHLIFNILLTFIAPVLNYIIIWYEKNASQQRHLLTNQLLSHVCIISIVRCFTVRIASLLWLHFGPFSTGVCDAALLAGRFFFVLVLVELTLWQFIKYLYLSWPKYLIEINDNFFSCFLTSLNIFSNIILLVVSHMGGFQNSELDYHICTGKDPQQNINETFNPLDSQQKDFENKLVTFKNVSDKDYVPTLTRILFLFLLFFAAQIWNKSLQESFSNHNLGDKSKLEISKEALYGAGGSLFVIGIMILLLIPSAVARTLSGNNPELINHGSGKIWTYMSRITIALISYCMVPIIIVLNNPNLRQTMKNKINVIFKTSDFYTVKCFKYKCSLS
jgi:hypothetical protein